MPNYYPEMKAQIAAMLAAKARDPNRRHSVDDPVTRYVLGQQQATGPSAADMAAQRRAEMMAKKRRENEVWDRIDKSLIYNPSPVVEMGPGVVPAAELGIGSAYDAERGGILHGLDTSKLEPRDIEFLRRYYAKQQQKEGAQ